MRNHTLSKNELITGIRNKYKILSPLSHGGSAITYNAIGKDDGLHYCIKELYPQKLDNNIIRTVDGIKFTDSLSMSKVDAESIYNKYITVFKREETLTRKIQKSVDKSNNDYSILALVDSFEDKGFYYNVYQTAGCTRLSDYIKKTAAEPLDVEKFKKYLDIISKVLSALNDIHNKKILHLDIAPDNILLMNESQETIRIIDFGSAIENYDTLIAKEDMIFSSKDGYSPLELVEYSKNNTNFVTNLTPATDIYSVAAILFNVIVGRTVECNDYILDDWKQELRKKLTFIKSSLEYNIQENLIRILEKGLNNDMSSRYVSAIDMKNEIDKLHDEIKQANTKIKGDKSEKKARKYIALSIIILLVISLVVVFLPNMRVMQAEYLYSNGNIKEAFQTIRSTHKYRWPIHFFFPEEKIDRLANEMYWNGAFGIDSITTFSNNVLGAAETTEENAIAAFLEDGRIVIKEKNSRESDDNLQEFKTTDCKNILFSANGRYCATIDSKKNMQVFALSSTAITPIYKRSDVKNISFSETCEEMISIYTDGTYDVFSLTKFSAIFESSSINAKITEAQDFTSNIKSLDLHLEKEKIAYIDSENSLHIVSLEGKNIGGTTSDNTPLNEIKIKDVAFFNNADNIKATKLNGNDSDVYELNNLKNSTYIRKGKELLPLFNGKVCDLSNKAVTVRFVNPAATTQIASADILDVPFKEGRGYIIDNMTDCIEVIGDYTLYYSNQANKLYRINNNLTNTKTEINISIAGENVKKIIANDMNNFVVISSNSSGHFAQSFEIKNNNAAPTSDVISAKNIFTDDDSEKHLIAMDDKTLEFYHFDKHLEMYTFGAKRPVILMNKDNTVFHYAKLNADKSKALVIRMLSGMSLNLSDDSALDVIAGHIEIYKMDTDKNKMICEKDVQIPANIGLNCRFKSASNSFNTVAYIAKNKETGRLSQLVINTLDGEIENYGQLIATRENLLECKFANDTMYSLDKQEMEKSSDMFILRRNKQVISTNVCSQNIIVNSGKIYFIERTSDGDSLMCVENDSEPYIVLKDVHKKLLCSEESFFTYSMSLEESDTIRIMGITPYKTSWGLSSATYTIYETKELFSLLENLYR